MSNPFMKPLYQGSENLYVYSALPLMSSESSKRTGDDITTICLYIVVTSPSRSDELKIIALATIYEERKTGKRMTLDEIGAFAWTLSFK